MSNIESSSVVTPMVLTSTLDVSIELNKFRISATYEMRTTEHGEICISMISNNWGRGFLYETER